MPDVTFSDAALRSAAARVRDSLLETLSPSGCDHVFSESFSERMSLLIGKHQRKAFANRMLRRAAIVFLVLLLGVSSFLAVNAEARAAFVRWIRQAYDNVIVYRFQGPPEEPVPRYALTWVPEGFEETKRIETDRSLQILYTNEETEELFAFEASLVHEGKESYIIMASDPYRHESLTVWGNRAEYYQEASPEEPDILMWFDSEETTVFYLHGFFDKAVMLRIAENVQPSGAAN